MNPQPALMLNHIHKVYGNGIVALHDMSLTLGESEFISLVGPSGCGKSTVLKIVSGLGSMTSGQLLWADPNNAKVQGRLAYVFQEPALMPWATVIENIHLPLKLMKVSKQEADQAVAEALKLVHLTGFEQAYPRQLSGGMRMRVSIARALVTKPRILLMDEPFGALDEMTRSKLNSDLLDLWQQKRWTVLFVTHNIYEAVYLSNRVIVMAALPGRVVADVEIDAPYPRTEEFRTSGSYMNYCRTVSHYLAEAMSNPPPVPRLNAAGGSRS